MSRNTLGLLISALLLLQFSNAVPVPREDIRHYFFFETAKFMKDQLMEGTHLIKNIKEKAAKIEPKSPKLSVFLEKFDQILNRIEEIKEEELNQQTRVTVFEVFFEFLANLILYDHEDFPVEISLKENGKEAYQAYFEKSRRKFSEELETHLSQYMDDLSSEEKKIRLNERLIHWVEEFKANATTRSFGKSGTLLEIFDSEWGSSIHLVRRSTQEQ